MKINDKHLVAFVNSSAPIDKEGYLQKRGEVNKAFQKRWFVLKGNLLFYFDKRGDRDPIGVIILETCTVELGDNTDMYSFDVVFQGSGSRTYTLAAETQEEMELWMKAITCAGYDYMKLMVNELQRQVDDLNSNGSAQARVRRGNTDSTASASSLQLSTRSDITKSVLRQSDQEKGLLVDLSLPSSNTPQIKQEKRIGRINPFDTDVFSDLPTSSTTNPFQNIAIERGVDALDLDCKDFLQMHCEFGDYIKRKCKLRTAADGSVI